jgi:hypothetical protein
MFGFGQFIKMIASEALSLFDDLSNRYGFIEHVVYYPPILAGDFDPIYYDITVRVTDNWPGEEDSMDELRLHLLRRAHEMIKEVRNKGFHLLNRVSIEFDSILSLPVCTLAGEVIKPEYENSLCCTVKLSLMRIGD